MADGGPQRGEGGVRVSPDQLQPATLRALVESFVSREGTDYGWREKTLEQKVADVLRQLENGEAVLLYDPDDESINIVPSSDAAASGVE